MHDQCAHTAHSPPGPPPQDHRAASVRRPEGPLWPAWERPPLPAALPKGRHRELEVLLQPSRLPHLF